MNLSELNRRHVIMGLAGVSFLAVSAGAQLVVKPASELKPGEFTWHPERAPDGPLTVVVSIPDQLVHVYRAGVRIALSTCSTGKEGHETPTGVFTILEKDRDHRSSTYNNAAMPNMNRLTWKGVALHAGKLPGYPASHGCVRLPLEFSDRLFGLTHVGTPVIIAGGHDYPEKIVHPGFVLDGIAETWAEQAVANVRNTSIPGADEAATAILVSSADREMLVLRNGKIVDRGAAMLNPGSSQRLGEHVYILQGAHDAENHLIWHAIRYTHDVGDADLPEYSTLEGLTAERELLDRLHDHLHPGTTLVLTDFSLHPSMRSENDFVIMNTDQLS